MTDFNVSELEQKFHSIEHLINEIVKYDTISDKMYETLKAKVGSFDQYFDTAPTSDAVYARVLKLKNLVDMIYTIMDQAHNNKDVGSQPTAVGDYFIDDNSFPLSAKTKSELLTIFKDKI